MHETMPVIHITHISFPAYTYTHGLPHACIYMYAYAHTHNACITVPPTQENLDMIFLFLGFLYPFPQCATLYFIPPNHEIVVSLLW